MIEEGYYFGATVGEIWYEVIDINFRLFVGGCQVVFEHRMTDPRHYNVIAVQCGSKWREVDVIASKNQHGDYNLVGVTGCRIW